MEENSTSELDNCDGKMQSEDGVELKLVLDVLDGEEMEIEMERR